MNCFEVPESELEQLNQLKVMEHARSDGARSFLHVPLITDSSWGKHGMKQNNSLPIKNDE